MKIKMLNEKGTKAEVPVEFYTEYKNKGFRPFKIKKMINKNGVKAEIPVELYDDYTKRGFVDAIKETPKVEEKGFLNSLADEANMIDATAGRSLNDLTELPANLLQMGYAGFKKGIDSLGNNAELGANPELGISADDITRAQQSDPSYNPFNKENTLGQIARIPNTAFNKTAEGIRNFAGMDENKYYNDDKAYEENLRNANFLKKLVHGGIYYGAPGGSLKNMGNAAKFGAVSTGIQEATGVNPILADIITALDPVSKAKKIGKVARSPIENIVYPLAKRKVGDIDVDAVENSARLFGDNTASLDNFRTGEGLDSLSSNLAHIGSKRYKNQQANYLNAFNSKLDEIGQNIGGTSQELKEVYSPLYESAKETAQNTPPQRLDDVIAFLKNAKEKNKASNSEGTTRGEIIKNVDQNLEGEFGLLNKKTFKKNKEALDYEVSQLSREVSPSETIIMRQNNNEDLRGFYKNKPYIEDQTIYSNYLRDFNKKLDEALKKMLPQKAYEDLNEANRKFGQGQNRDLYEKLLDPTFDYTANRLKIDKIARMLNTPKDIKKIKALAKKEDHETLDNLAKISQRVSKTNARNAGRTGSGQARTGEEVAYEAAKAAIEAAITGKTPTGIIPLLTRYTYGQAMGNLMTSPKFRDYMIRVSKNPKDTKAKLALDAIIQKNTGLTTKQLSTILARDSVNLLTNSDDSGQ